MFLISNSKSKQVHLLCTVKASMKQNFMQFQNLFNPMGHQINDPSDCSGRNMIDISKNVKGIVYML